MNNLDFTLDFTICVCIVSANISTNQLVFVKLKGLYKNRKNVSTFLSKFLLMNGNTIIKFLEEVNGKIWTIKLIYLGKLNRSIKLVHIRNDEKIKLSFC